MDSAGKLVWSSVLDPTTLHAPSEHGLGRAHILVEPGLGVGILGTSYGFSLENGRELWRYEGGPRSQNPLVVNFFQHEGVLFALYETEIVAVDASTGAERWRIPADPNRRFYRLPGRVVIQTWGSKEAAVHDLLTGAKTTLRGPLCRFGTDLLAVRADGSTTYAGNDLQPIVDSSFVIARFERPRCALRGDRIVVAEASELGAHFVSLDRRTLGVRWELDFRTPPLTSLDKVAADRLAWMDPLPKLMPVRVGNVRKIIDLDAGTVESERDLVAEYAAEGYLAANQHFFGVGSVQLTRFRNDASDTEASGLQFTASLPVFSDNVAWVFEDGRVGRLRADTLEPMRGSGWVSGDDGLLGWLDP